MSIVDEKKKIRAKMLAQRNALDVRQKEVYDQWICESLIEQVISNGIHSVHVYIPMGSEINILPFIQFLLDENKTVIAPKTLHKPQLENRILTSLTALEKGVYGTVHPSNPTIYTGKIDLIIIPGLAIDKNNFRLGYGGGYYDTFLYEYPEAIKTGIYYPFQLIDTVPTEPHDQRIDKVLIGPGMTGSTH